MKHQLIIGSFRIHVWYIFILIAAIAFMIPATIRTIENYRLEKHGRVVRAFVVNTKTVGGKGTVQLKFRYKVAGVEYVEFLNNEPYNAGDSVYLLYLENSPEVIRTYRFIYGIDSPSK
ncbi:MAG TPA: hypothetical protein VFE50_01495 [Cyclobacteriaceae bacterium]|nr:hypothetical protein [Cyclobacteriaceae bacterium]